MKPGGERGGCGPLAPGRRALSRRACHGVEVVPASRDQEPVIANLFELYAYDLSQTFDLHVGPDGRYGYPRLPLYWQEASRHPPDQGGGAPGRICARLARVAPLRRSRRLGHGGVLRAEEVPTRRGWREGRARGLASPSWSLGGASARGERTRAEVLAGRRRPLCGGRHTARPGGARWETTALLCVRVCRPRRSQRRPVADRRERAWLSACRALDVRVRIPHVKGSVASTWVSRRRSSPPTAPSRTRPKPPDPAPRRRLRCARTPLAPGCCRVGREDRRGLPLLARPPRVRG